MNLGKLLASGKSIMNARKDVSYRSSKQIYLPKFVSEKNPFRNEARPSVVAAAPVPTPGVLPAVSACAPPKPAAPAVPIQKTAAAKTQKIPVFAEARKDAPGWADKFNPMSIFRGSPAKSRAAARAEAAGNAAPTQVELSLDAVRVVHNDLSDVDVEVVPIKSRPAAPEQQPARKSWELLGERLFGVEAT